MTNSEYHNTYDLTIQAILDDRREDAVQLIAKMIDAFEQYPHTTKFLALKTDDKEFAIKANELAFAAYHHRWVGETNYLKSIAVDAFLQVDDNLLFEKFLTAKPWSLRKIYEGDASKMVSDKSRRDDMAMVISGITFSLLHHFDNEAFAFLVRTCLDFSTSEERRSSDIFCRSLLGVALTIARHERLISLCPRMTALAELITKRSDRFADILLTAQLIMLNSARSADIITKFKKDMGPTINDVKKALDENLIKEDDEEGGEEEMMARLNMNSDDIFGKLADMFQELQRYENKGVDFHTPTFQHAKNHQFFNTMNNWVRPFNPNNEAIASVTKSANPLIQDFVLSVVSNNTICNSDIYSALLYVKGIDQDKIHKYIPKLPQELVNDMKIALKSNKRSAKDTMLRYIHDLYRLLTMMPHRKELFNIFSVENIAFLTKKPLLDMTFGKGHKEELDIHTALIKLKLYDEAIMTSEAMTDSPATPIYKVFERRAYSYDHMELYDTAAMYYDLSLRANPANPNWRRHMMAKCLRNANKCSEAIDTIKKINNWEDNFELLELMGVCQFILKNYEEALAIFHKIDYFKPEQTNFKGMIGWANILLGRPEKAFPFAQAASKDSNSPEDSLLLAHCVCMIHGFEVAKPMYLEIRNWFKKNNISIYKYSRQMTSGDFLLKAISETELQQLHYILYEEKRDE